MLESVSLRFRKTRSTIDAAKKRCERSKASWITFLSQERKHILKPQRHFDLYCQVTRFTMGIEIMIDQIDLDYANEWL